MENGVYQEQQEHVLLRSIRVGANRVRESLVEREWIRFLLLNDSVLPYMRRVLLSKEGEEKERGD